MLFSIYPGVWMLTFPSHLREFKIVQNKSIRIMDQFLAHPRKTEKLSETKRSFFFLDILDLCQIFHLTLVIWFLHIQDRDHFSPSPWEGLQATNFDQCLHIVMMIGKCTDVFRGILWLGGGGGGVRRRRYVGETFHGGICHGGRKFPWKGRRIS